MKLAEALMLRSDSKVKISKIKKRIDNNLKLQEGDEVAEDPRLLIKEMEKQIDKFTDLKIRINKTNSNTIISDNMTIADALALRDSLVSHRQLLEKIAADASIRQSRESRSEIKYISTVNVLDIQKKIDKLSKEFRILDTTIQEKNWLIELE